jgi:hypothetical protein
VQWLIVCSNNHCCNAGAPTVRAAAGDGSAGYDISGSHIWDIIIPDSLGCDELRESSRRMYAAKHVL